MQTINTFTYYLTAATNKIIKHKHNQRKPTLTSNITLHNHVSSHVLLVIDANKRLLYYPRYWHLKENEIIYTKDIFNTFEDILNI